MFQFRFGSIESLIIRSLISRFMSFNSALVRLRADFEANTDLVLLSFNSALVRLRAKGQGLACVSYHGFNSALVRLREPRI